MNNHKLKKKFIHNDSRSSIKNQENKFLETIKKNKESIPRKKSDLEKLIKKYNTIQQGHEKFDIGKKIAGYFRYRRGGSQSLCEEVSEDLWRAT